MRRCENRPGSPFLASILDPTSNQGFGGRPDPGQNIDVGQRRLGDGRGSPAGTAECAHEDRDKASNLILLCRDPHKLIDSQLTRFGVGVLRQMKHVHESWVDR